MEQHTADSEACHVDGRPDTFLWFKMNKRRVKKDLKTNLFIVGKAAHDRRVHNPVEHHRERMNGERAVTGLSLDQITQLLIGQLHGFYGVVQWTDLFLETRRLRGKLLP